MVGLHKISAIVVKDIPTRGTRCTCSTLLVGEMTHKHPIVDEMRVG